MSARSEAYNAFLRLLEGEIERRRAAAFAAAGGDPLEALLAKFDEMAERLRAAPEWCEPTPAQQRNNTHQVEMWFKRHGYLS